MRVRLWLISFPDEIFLMLFLACGRSLETGTHSYSLLTSVQLAFSRQQQHFFLPAFHFESEDLAEQEVDVLRRRRGKGEGVK